MYNQSARHSLIAIPLATVVLLVAPGWGVAQTRGPFFGSVPAGQPTGTTLDLSLQQAFERALKYNLGEIESRENTRAAHACACAI